MSKANLVVFPQQNHTQQMLTTLLSSFDTIAETNLILAQTNAMIIDRLLANADRAARNHEPLPINPDQKAALTQMQQNTKLKHNDACFVKVGTTVN